MKKVYVKPVMLMDTFEVNESISACTIAEDGIDTQSYVCGHTEHVTFGASTVAGVYRVYNKDGLWIADGTLDPDGHMVWITIDLGVSGAYATTNHKTLYKVGANHS